MNKFLIGCLAFLMTVTSVVTEVRPFLEADFKQVETLDQNPAWDLDNVLHTNSEKTHKVHSITISESNIMTAPMGWSLRTDFGHYLPIYNLVRQKEYFLLI